VWFFWCFWWGVGGGGGGGGGVLFWDDHLKASVKASSKDRGSIALLSDQQPTALYSEHRLDLGRDKANATTKIISRQWGDQGELQRKMKPQQGPVTPYWFPRRNPVKSLGAAGEKSQLDQGPENVSYNERRCRVFSWKATSDGGGGAIHVALTDWSWGNPSISEKKNWRK